MFPKKKQGPKIIQVIKGKGTSPFSIPSPPAHHRLWRHWTSKTVRPARFDSCSLRDIGIPWELYKIMINSCSIEITEKPLNSRF